MARCLADLVGHGKGGYFSGHVWKELVASTETFQKLSPELVAQNRPPFHDKLFNSILAPKKRENHTNEK
jgi:hypothetical protein